MGVPVIVMLVATDGVRWRVGIDGRDMVESSRLLFLSADLRLCTSTPESLRFGVGTTFGGSIDLGGRTTIDRRLHKCCSLSGMAVARTGSLFRDLIDRDLVMAGLVTACFGVVGLVVVDLVSMDLAGSGGTSSLSFFAEKIFRIIVRIFCMDLVRFIAVGRDGADSCVLKSSVS